MVCYINDQLDSGLFPSSSVSEITKDDMMCCYEHCTTDAIFSVLQLLPPSATLVSHDIKIRIELTLAQNEGAAVSEMRINVLLC